MVLDAITQVELFINVFTTVYTLAVFLYVLASWFRLPYSLNPVQRFLYDVCEPYLRLWRRILPLSFGPVDLTPMIAIFALVALSQIVIAVLDRLH
jgi:YggT family protein